MAEQDVLKLAREGIDAFNAGDWQRFKAPLAPDTVYYEPATQRRVQGPDQAVQVSQAWRQAFPDAKGTITKTVVSGDTAVIGDYLGGTPPGSAP
jgi:ketosteroid isomerase-like protein